VYNAEAYLDACLASVLAQDFTDYELILYDDGCTDGSAAKLADWAGRDPRIRVERGSARLGPVGSSNRIVELARAPLIARLDADDLMLPGRLTAQVAAFDEQPGAVLIGGLAWTIDAAGRRMRAPDLARLLRASDFAPFPHSSAMFRREAWERIGGYRAGTEKWEDVDFFLRMSAIGSVWVVPRPLAAYRQNADTTRLHEGLGELEQAMNRMARTLEPDRPSSSSRIAPAAFRHIGATLLWSGGGPPPRVRPDIGASQARDRPRVDQLARLGGGGASRAGTLARHVACPAGGGQSPGAPPAGRARSGAMAPRCHAYGLIAASSRASRSLRPCSSRSRRAQLARGADQH